MGRAKIPVFLMPGQECKRMAWHHDMSNAMCGLLLASARLHRLVRQVHGFTAS